MTTGERLFWRVFAADILLAGIWLLIGGAILEACIFAATQALCLTAVDGVIRAVHQVMEEVRERRIARWERRRSR